MIAFAVEKFIENILEAAFILQPVVKTCWTKF